MKSLSFGKGKGNIAHNNRDYETPNVDHDRVKDNVTFVKQDIQDAYKELFQGAIDEYNARQKRSDRQKSVDGYMNEIRRNQANRNGEKLFYEQVIGVGDMFDSGILSHPEEAEKCKSILMDYMKEWKERNPNLHVFNAVLHMDESTPHLHVDFIPVGHGYKQGLQARNSLTKAFENMGIDSAKSKGDNATIKWQQRERGRIIEIAKEHGVEIGVVGIKRKDYKLDEYKALVSNRRHEVQATERVKPSRINLPFGLALETNRKEVDKALDRQYKIAELSKEYKQATKDISTATKGVKSALQEVKGVKQSLEVEKAQNSAKYEEIYGEYIEARQTYQSAYEEQLELNKAYERLYAQYEDVSAQLQEQKAENSTLRAQMDDLSHSADDRVQKVIKEFRGEIEALEGQIEALEEQKNDIATSVLSITKAVSEIKTHLKVGGVAYKICEGIEKYAKRWLAHDGFMDKANEVGKAGLVSGISMYVDDGSRGVKKSKNDIEH